MSWLEIVVEVAAILILIAIGRVIIQLEKLNHRATEILVALQDLEKLDDTATEILTAIREKDGFDDSEWEEPQRE